MVSSHGTCMHAAPVLGILQPVPPQACCNSCCFWAQVRWAHLAWAGAMSGGKGSAGVAHRGGSKGSQAQTGVILAATVGPLLAGVALSYFLSGAQSET